MNYDKKPRVAVVSGQWGQNVGNAFFNIGGMYVMESVFGKENVAFFQDQPNYRTLHNKFKGNPKSYVDFSTHLDIDFIVLQGPVLNSWMRHSWEEAFKAFKKNNVKVILHSCAFFKFTNKEIEDVKNFLDEYPPYLISTRDSRSFELIKDWIPNVPKYNGIDAGFFVNKVVKPFKVRNEFEYMVSNFDRYPEPKILLSKTNRTNDNIRSIEFKGKKIDLIVPRFLNYTSHRSKIWSYIGDFLDRRVLSEQFEGLKIVRPEHRFFPHMTHKIYRQSNSFVSDEPWTYLHVYANTQLTLSDRVHACVATLAYGRPAMLLTPSPRRALFERVGAKNIFESIVELDSDFLDIEQSKQIDWIRSQI